MNGTDLGTWPGVESDSGDPEEPFTYSVSSSGELTFPGQQPGDISSGTIALNGEVVLLHWAGDEGATNAIDS